LIDFNGGYRIAIHADFYWLLVIIHTERLGFLWSRTPPLLITITIVTRVGIMMIWKHLEDRDSSTFKIFNISQLISYK
jgi:hypothetical protein